MDTQGDFKKCCLEYFSLISALDTTKQSETRKCSCGSSFLITYLNENKIVIKTENSLNGGILLRQFKTTNVSLRKMSADFLI